MSFRFVTPPPHDGNGQSEMKKNEKKKRGEEYNDHCWTFIWSSISMIVVMALMLMMDSTKPDLNLSTSLSSLFSRKSGRHVKNVYLVKAKKQGKNEDKDLQEGEDERRIIRQRFEDLLVLPSLRSELHHRRIQFLSDFALESINRTVTHSTPLSADKEDPESRFASLYAPYVDHVHHAEKSYLLRTISRRPKPSNLEPMVGSKCNLPQGGAIINEEMLDVGVGDKSKGRKKARKKVFREYDDGDDCSTSMLPPLAYPPPPPPLFEGSSFSSTYSEKKEEEKEDSPICVSTVVLLRHCEKVNYIKEYCALPGYRRSLYLSTLFGLDDNDDNGKHHQHPPPSEVSIIKLRKLLLYILNPIKFLTILLTLLPLAAKFSYTR